MHGRSAARLTGGHGGGRGKLFRIFVIGSGPIRRRSSPCWAERLHGGSDAMKLSVVIPAYNEENNIGKCLDELRAVVCKKYQIPCEIIVVNDNSTDGTSEV